MVRIVSILTCSNLESLITENFDGVEEKVNAVSTGQFQISSLVSQQEYAVVDFTTRPLTSYTVGKLTVQAQSEG